MSAHNNVETSPAGEAAARPDFDDVAREFDALRSRSAIFSLSGRAKIALTGGDRVRWLNGMVTNNVRDLAVGHGVYSFLLNPQGHILGDLYAYNRGESLVVDTDRSQLDKILATFDHYIIMDDVEVANVSDKLTAIGFAGPETKTILRAAGLELPELQPLQFVGLTWKQVRAMLVRADNPGVESYELWLAPENAFPLWDAFVNAGVEPAGTDALEMLRIACGIPRYGQDIRERDLPQETEQQRALHFSKGCYVGQEIVERIHSRGNVHRKFTGFTVEGPVPAPGTKLRADGKDIGEITSAASLPGRAIALGYMRREAAIPGKEVSTGNSRLVVASLPFADILKN